MATPSGSGRMEWFLLALRIGLVSAVCPPDGLLLYRMVLRGEWSEEAFPRQYPQFRPPAQWSVVAGRTHNSSGVLWRLGSPASDSVKMFVETGEVNKLVREGYDDQGMLSEFFAPPLPKGVGITETKFFADFSHSKVSIICRITPSPDWFIGVDSFDLCRGNNWVDSVTLDLQPIDGGTDNGYTFTSPKYSTEPRSNITIIQSRYPDHPAGSFFYPDLEKLPRIASVKFIKLKEYFLTKEIFRDFKEESFKIKSAESVMRPLGKSGDSITYTVHPDEQEAIPLSSIQTLKQCSTECMQAKHRKRKNVQHPDATEFRSKNATAFRSKNGKAKRKRPKPCKVSEWSDWGSCSNGCGFGEQTRHRKPLQYNSRGGRVCPPFMESKWCRSSEKCHNKTVSYFRWQ